MITLPPVLFLAGSPGPLEVLVIFAVVLVLFGPRKLPGIARSLGRMLSELRKASEEFRSQVMSIRESNENSSPNPPERLPQASPQTDASDAEHDEIAIFVPPTINADSATSDTIQNRENSTQG